MQKPLDDNLPIWVKEKQGVFEIRIKVVPGASQTEIVGVLGDRLKIRVAAPPENGKANREVIKVLEKTFGLKSVEITFGATHPEKTFSAVPTSKTTFQ